MVLCPRCWLNYALRIVNLVANFLGMGLIIYSLCLLKIWREAISEVGSTTSSFPRPWFIYAFLGVGIIACFNALLGHIVSNRISTAALSTYIVIIVSIIVFQILVIKIILFNIDWQSIIYKYIDGEHITFESILIFHLNLCRLMGITILLAQIKAVVLAIVLCALGPEPRSHCLDSPATPNFRHSFLVARSDSPPAFPASVQTSITRFWN